MPAKRMAESLCAYLCGWRLSCGKVCYRPRPGETALRSAPTALLSLRRVDPYCLQYPHIE